MFTDAGYPAEIACLDDACGPMSEAKFAVLDGTTAVVYG